MKNNRILLSAVLITALLAAGSAAWAATVKGSSGNAPEPVQTEAMEPQTEATAPQTEAFEPQTDAAEPQPEVAGTKMEGDGFLTPRDALAAYIKGLQDNDIDEMISAFAVESVAVNYDLAKMVERTRAFMPSIGYIPNVNDLSTRINIENRRKTITDTIRFHYLALTESPLITENNYGQPITLSDKYESAQALVDSLFIPSNTDLLGSIRFEGEYYSPALLSDHYMNMYNLENLKRQAEQVGAQGISSVAAKFYCNDRPYLIAMDAIQYGTKWYLYSGTGNLAILLNMDTFKQGLIPLDTLMEEGE